ncbi:hypothetical protein CDAR_172301 [Caerostris darwini]|uniref:Uncharacterized protein n=1 Tax=Caerostris darwini TaxID=1538125 RepID=A0AAV4ME61_9ARAC|nr:hypothetical protein CDAR_172301 [Caerostris darwini]
MGVSRADRKPIHFLNPGETITSEKYYLEIDKIHQKPQHLCSVLVNRKGFNSSANSRQHVSQMTAEFQRHAVSMKLNELEYEIVTPPANLQTSHRLTVTFSRF